MTRSVAGLAVVIFLTGGSALAQSATFSRADYLSLGNNHVVADLNGDGRPDVAGIGPMSAAVMLGNGDGTFGARALYPVATWAQDLAAGDFDGDGRLDLVVTVTDPQVSLSLLFGNGDGTFGAAVNIPNTSGYDTPAVVTTDLNDDGRLDLVLGHQMSCFTAPCTVSQIIAVMLGNGDGTFQPADEIFVGTATAKIAVGDFDRDGVKDLALASDRSRVHILLGAGDGSFRSQTTLTLIPENNIGMDCTDVDVADLDGDGLQDLVVAVALNGSRTAILLGNGDGTFRPPHLITEPALRIPHYQAIADYNGDGFLDLALSLGWGSEGLFEILNGRGDGTFGAPVLYLRPPDRSSIGGFAIVAGDFNGDGKPDLALGIVGASPAFAALTNTTGQAPPPTPSAPTLLSPANDASPAQPVTFDWSDVNAATAYRIQIDDSSSFSTPLVVDRVVTPSQFTAGTLAARRHWWRVRGINSAGVAGPWSTVRRFTPQSTTTTGPTLSSIVLAPTSVTGGSGSQGTATLSSAAPSGGAVVPLTSSNPAVASAPSSVTVPAGSTSASFAVTTTQVTSLTGVTFTGTYGGVSRSATLTVNPPPAPASLNAVSVSPTSVVGGSASQGIVGLTAVAPEGGFTVAMSSSNAAATVPANVTVAAGAPSATFSVTTTQVAASTAVTITATAGGVARTTTLTVTPPQQTATLTVTASGRSGERVVSSPSGINVSVGSTGSASFTTGTSITLSVSNSRDAIWSGACSSGGNKTKTCTFTLQANASVTANVQ